MNARTLSLLTLLAPLACMGGPKGVHTDAAPRTQRTEDAWGAQTDAHAAKMIEEGRRIFRADTFGSEEFWGGQLRLHQAIAGEQNGGVGPGVTPRQALQLGLKVDVNAVPGVMGQAIKAGTANLDDPPSSSAWTRTRSARC